VGHYIPITWLTFASTMPSGAWIRRLPLTSIVFHAINAVLVYLVALRLLTLAW
jgi:hypothetical protein